MPAWPALFPRLPVLLVLCLAASLAAGACSRPPAPAVPAPRALPEPSVDQWRRAQGIMHEVNAFRARHGLRPLVLERHLMAAAQAHVDDIVQDGFRLSHRGSDGSMIEDRVERIGYDYLSVAENVAASRATFEGTVEQWQISPCHRFAMMRPHYVHAGVGYAYSETDRRVPPFRHWWVLVMARPDPSMAARTVVTAGVTAGGVTAGRTAGPVLSPVPVQAAAMELPANCRIR